MKSLHRLVFAIALVLPLAACAGLIGTGGSVAVAASNTSIRQASTVKAAGDMFVLADKAATAYFNSGKATKAQALAAIAIEAQVYDALKAGRAADAAGNSPAVAAALSLFNANYAKLAGLIPGL